MKPANTTYYEIANANISSEIMDGEAIIINMETGTYYSLDGAGVPIWAQLQKGVNLEDLSSVLCDKYAGESPAIEQGLKSFVEELLQEELIKASEQPEGERKILTDAEAFFPQDKPPFTQPQLNKYSDMQGLLLIDPIHDVSEGGWPNVPAQANSKS